jgi:hypothetical protein
MPKQSTEMNMTAEDLTQGFLFIHSYLTVKGKNRGFFCITADATRDEPVTNINLLTTGSRTEAEGFSKEFQRYGFNAEQRPDSRDKMNVILSLASENAMSAYAAMTSSLSDDEQKAVGKEIARGIISNMNINNSPENFSKDLLSLVNPRTQKYWDPKIAAYGLATIKTELEKNPVKPTALVDVIDQMAIFSKYGPSITAQCAQARREIAREMPNEKGKA